jgi:hypothetical protein
MFAVVSISKADLRLMAIAEKQTPVTELLAEILPWTWGAFVVAAITGILMFTSNARSFYADDSFRPMILCIGLAGINLGVFHAFTYRRVALWDSDVPTVFAAKVAGGFSLALWIAVVVFAVRILFTVEH